MKKKQFTSRLQFRKNTIVSFNAIQSIQGGALQNVNTQIISIDGLMCITVTCTTTCPTDATQTAPPTTQAYNTCPAPTNGGGNPETDFCGLDITKRGCLDTRRC